MNSNYDDFLELISVLNDKTGEFGCSRFGPNNKEISEKVDKNPIDELILYLKEELHFISKKFEVDEQSAMVIAAMLIQYHLRKNEELYFITIDDLASSLCLKVPEFLSFASSVCDLKNKNFIKIKDLDFAFLKKIEEVDQTTEYLELSENLSSEKQTKTYEFTSNFINKIINL